MNVRDDRDLGVAPVRVIIPMPIVEELAVVFEEEAAVLGVHRFVVGRPEAADAHVVPVHPHRCHR